jgi:thiol-disulfide isomerase/thioredoxin
MKNNTFLIILFLVCIISCNTIRPAGEINPQIEARVPATDTFPKALNFSDQSSWVLGYFCTDRLTREPHSLWYIGGYDNYQANSDALNKLLDISKDNLTIKIVMGTWCPDSRREVPRFMRVLDMWNFPQDNVTFIGVDNTKLAPVGGYDTLNIERVPTFIILKNKVEAGRIIENPETSLEQDIVNILTRNEK